MLRHFDPEGVRKFLLKIGSFYYFDIRDIHNNVQRILTVVETLIVMYPELFTLTFYNTIHT
jgi:hypothetical protein